MRASFLHITDLHFWEIVRNPLKLLNKRFLGNANVALRRRHHFRQDLARKHFEAVRNTNVQAILLGGDFTSTATDGEFAAAAGWIKELEGFARELLLVPGNHDVYTFESVRAGRSRKHLGTWLPGSGYPTVQRLGSGLPVVMAPTVCPNLLSSRGNITDGEIAQVARLALECPPGPVVVLAHYPCLNKTWAYESGWSRQLRNAEAFRRTLGGLGRPILFLAGHVHRFSYVQDPEYPHLCHLCSPAFFLHRPGTNVDGAFTEIQITGGHDFEVFLHEHGTEWTRTPQPLRHLDGSLV